MTAISLPDDAERMLTEGAAALGLALEARQRQLLLDHLGLIARWNRVYNLTAVREPAQMLTQHLLDSLALVPPLRRHTGGDPAAVLDVGSGAGLPGVVLAIACPELAVSCVDTVAKKAGFLRQVGAELSLHGFQALHARVESLASRPWDVIVSRAFSSLVDFVELTEALLAPEGVWVAMKGRRPEDEIAALPERVEMFHVEPLQVPGLDAERCLVWMRPRR
ncbi:MAG TPA: 16S rRNA (guanine(527)-N(7))-methyltransferase RsmG [Methylibium sp.]|nr:16S rRNA (guanine(527)-N(7))-methyltransferase RsmG [Methylibium sp.]